MSQIAAQNLPAYAASLGDSHARLDALSELSQRLLDRYNRTLYDEQEERERKARTAAGMLGIEHLLDRRPRQLSGG